MEKSTHFYNIHILEFISNILNYTAGIEKDVFLSTLILKDATVRNFELIGEATKQLDESFRKKHSHIEWKKTAGMRDKLIQGYLEVDYEIAWNTIVEILPNLQEDLEKILKNNK